MSPAKGLLPTNTGNIWFLKTLTRPLQKAGLRKLALNCYYLLHSSDSRCSIRGVDYATSSWSRALFKQLTVTPLVEIFPLCYVIRGLHTVSATDQHWHLTKVRWIQCKDHNINSSRSTLIFYIQVLLCFQCSFSASDLPTKIHTSLLPYVLRVPPITCH